MGSNLVFPCDEPADTEAEDEDDDHAKNNHDDFSRFIEPGQRVIGKWRLPRDPVSGLFCNSNFR